MYLFNNFEVIKIKLSYSQLLQIIFYNNTKWCSKIDVEMFKTILSKSESIPLQKLTLKYIDKNLCCNSQKFRIENNKLVQLNYLKHFSEFYLSCKEDVIYKFFKKTAEKYGYVKKEPKYEPVEYIWFLKRKHIEKALINLSVF